MDRRALETPAPPLRRLGAFAIDYVVIATYVALLTAAGFAVRAALDVEARAPQTVIEKLAGHGAGLLTLTAPVVLYFALSEASRRQATLGKRAMRLRVVSSRSGKRLKLRRCLVRAAVKFAPWELAHVAIWHSPGRPFVDPPGIAAWFAHGAAIGLALWFLLSLFTKSGRTPYDRWSRSRVVLAPRGVVHRRIGAAAVEVVEPPEAGEGA